MTGENHAALYSDECREPKEYVLISQDRGPGQENTVGNGRSCPIVPLCSYAVLGSIDDVVLDLLVQLSEIGAVSCYPNQQIRKLLGVLLGFSQYG